MNADPLDLATLHKRTLGNVVLRDDLLRLFREHGPRAVSNVTAAAQARDADAVKAAAHRLKGSAATIAATALADIARRIEQAAVAGDWATLAANLDRASDEFRCCLKQIDQLLSA